MNPLVSSLVGALVRWLITIAAAHGIALADDQATQIVSGLFAAATLAWSFWRKREADAKGKTAAVTGTVPK